MCADTAECAHLLIRKGICDLKHALERLRSHEHSMEHIDATITFSRRYTVFKNYEELIQNYSHSGQSMRTKSEIGSACNVWFLS